ncbi:MAG: hypothetical protein AB4372_08265 [Xenococcus sp. (in: cyanobacteria)]
MPLANQESSNHLVNQDSSHNPAEKPQKTHNNVQLIRALTPIAIAIIGGLIGISAILVNHIDSNKLTAAMGLAGTAMAGASGLAQSDKKE